MVCPNCQGISDHQFFCPFCNCELPHDLFEDDVEEGLAASDFAQARTNVPEFNTITSSKEARNLAVILNSIIPTYHIFLWFTARYMVYIHQIWTFYRNLTTGVIPNNRVKDDDKLEWCKKEIKFLNEKSDHIVYFLDDPQKITHEMVDQNFLIPQKEPDKQKSSRYYYNKLDLKSTHNISLLGKMIYSHSIFGKFLESFEANPMWETVKGKLGETGQQKIMK